MSYDPIQARDAEAQLLGAALAGYPDLDDLLALVEPADFYTPVHEAIWDAIGRVHQGGTRPDPTSVRLALGDHKPAVDPTLLLDLVSGVQAIVNAPHFATVVVEAAGGRDLQAGALRAQQIAGSTAGTLEERREAAVEAISDAARGRTVNRARTLAQILPGVIDTAQQGQSASLSTPWPDLNAKIGGIAPGRLIVVAARPGGGKSLFGTNLALHVTREHDHAALLCSLEMPEAEVGQRLLSAHARVDLTALQEGDVDDAGWERVARKSAELMGLPLTVDDNPNLTVAGIRRAARMVQRTRDDLALIVVDYLQLVAPTRRPGREHGSRAEEISEIARGLKLLARETGACVVAMAQVNRAGGLRDTGPTMNDIREGGAENDADAVILIHRPDIETPELKVSVGKNRHGPIGDFPLALEGHYSLLQSVSWNPTRGIA